MKLSVVLPVYNGENSIERAVQSLLEQSFTDFELVVVNDGSTDGTAGLIHRLCGRDRRIKYLNLGKSGIARALNFGIKMSIGKYIARMDADDVAYPDRLLKQYRYLEEHPHVGLVSCLVSFRGNPDAQEGYKTYVDWINTMVTHRQIQLKRFQESPFAHPSVCFRRQLVDQFGGYSEENVPEDYELWLRWLHAGVVMEKIPEYLLDWHDHPSRLSRVHPHYSMENFYQVKALYLKKYLEQTFPKNMPEVFVWGAGRTTNNRVKPLLNLGLKISKYIDVKTRSGQDPRFIHYSELPDPGGIFILSYVSDRKGKKEIHTYLEENGYVEGRDFLMCS